MLKFRHVQGFFEINAIAWAAQRAGASYGQFAATLTAEQKEQIFLDYREMKRQQGEELLERMKQRKHKRTVALENG